MSCRKRTRPGSGWTHVGHIGLPSSPPLYGPVLGLDLKHVGVFFAPRKAFLLPLETDR